PLPIGLDIGHSSVKAIQLRADQEHLSVIASARESITEPLPADGVDRVEALTDLLRGIRRSGGFYGRGAVIALPPDLVHTKNMRLPPMPESELASAVDFEARTVFPFSAESAVTRFIRAGEVRQGTELKQEVIVFGAPRDPIDRLVEVVHRTGFNVESIDLSSCALFRCVDRFARRAADQTEVHVMLDIGCHHTTVIIGRGRELGFVKTIDVGVEPINEAVAAKLSISVDEARQLRRRLAEPGRPPDSVASAVYDVVRAVLEPLGREVALCLRYYSVTFRGQRPAQVRVYGGGGTDPQVIDALSGALTIPVTSGRPLSGVGNCELFDDGAEAPLSEWALASGLALRMTEGPFVPGPGNALSAPRRSTAEVIDLDSVIATEPLETKEAVHA
ncbi:MAG TPA: pilus assembly protein PilM, partial [Tepidisphaeraceae bacterium]|nr:pilus assembly protein PilM [Tepidisphaeraceae bacterium]